MKNKLFKVNGEIVSLEEMVKAWLEKYNPNHDERGRFAEGGGSGTGSDDDYAPISVGYNVSDSEIKDTFGSRYQSFEGTVYRGPNKYRTSESKNPNVYGDGKYYAFTAEGAKTFTDHPEAHKVFIDNPLRITSRNADETFRSFVERDTGIKVTYPWPTSRLAERAMTAWLRDQGYDGIVVDYKGAPGGNQVIQIT